MPNIRTGAFRRRCSTPGYEAELKYKASTDQIEQLEERLYERTDQNDASGCLVDALIAQIADLKTELAHARAPPTPDPGSCSSSTMATPNAPVQPSDENISNGHTAPHTRQTVDDALMRSEPPNATSLKMSEEAGVRIEALTKVYQMFNLDGSTAMGEEELLQIGQAKRELAPFGQTWTRDENSKLMQRIGTNEQGNAACYLSECNSSKCECITVFTNRSSRVCLLYLKAHLPLCPCLRIEMTQCSATAH